MAPIIFMIGMPIAVRNVKRVLQNGTPFAVLWYVLSHVAMHVCNKNAVDALGQPATLFLFEALGTLLLLIVCSGLAPLRLSRICVWIPVAATFFAMVFSFIKGAKALNLTTSVVFRNLAPLVSVMWEFVTGGRTVSWSALIALVGIVFGCVLYGLYGHETLELRSAEGVAWLVFSLVMQVAFVAQVHAASRIPSTAGMSTNDKTLHNNLLSIPFGCFALYFGEHTSVLDSFGQMAWYKWGWIVVTCISAFFISRTQFEVQRRVPPTTYHVIAGVDELIVMAVGIMVMKDNISWLSGLGCAIALFSAVVYGVAS